MTKCEIIEIKVYHLIIISVQGPRQDFNEASTVLHISDLVLTLDGEIIVYLGRDDLLSDIYISSPRIDPW